MATQDSEKGLDLLGIQPVAKSIERVTDGAVSGAGAFLSRVCLPAAEEFGLLLRDNVRAWRSKNLIAIEDRAKQKYEKLSEEKRGHIHPRIAHRIIENGSWEDNGEVQELWSGLILSGCNEKGDDQSNLIYIDLLSRMTSNQAIFFSKLCENSNKNLGAHNLVYSDMKDYALSDILKISLTKDIASLDFEIDYLRELGVLDGGFSISTELCHICPTPLGLNLYVRCQGFKGPALDYFGLGKN